MGKMKGRMGKGMLACEAASAGRRALFGADCRIRRTGQGKGWRNMLL